MKQLLFIIACTVALITSATDYTYVQGSTWNDGTTWGVASNKYPGSGALAGRDSAFFNNVTCEFNLPISTSKLKSLVLNDSSVTVQPSFPFSALNCYFTNSVFTLSSTTQIWDNVNILANSSNSKFVLKNTYLTVPEKGFFENTNEDTIVFDGVSKLMFSNDNSYIGDAFKVKFIVPAGGYTESVLNVKTYVSPTEIDVNAIKTDTEIEMPFIDYTSAVDKPEDVDKCFPNLPSNVELIKELKGQYVSKLRLKVKPMGGEQKSGMAFTLE